MILNEVDRLLPSRIREHLATKCFGRRIFYYPGTDSTNRVAMDLARGGEPEGTVVVADFQTAGRGRLDRVWTSPAGRDVLFTLVLRPDERPQDVLPVTLVFSAAIAAFLSERLRHTVSVKWPNDVVTTSGKIGGILAESSVVPGRSSFVAVGVGINVNSARGDFPEEIRGRSASCATLTGGEWDRADVLAGVLLAMEELHDGYRTGGFAAIRSYYEGLLSVLGRRVSFERKGARMSGTVDGVNDDGALRVTPRGGGDPMVLYGEEVVPET